MRNLDFLSAAYMIVWTRSMAAFHWLMWWRLGVVQVGFKDGTLGERLNHSGSAFIYGLIHWWVQHLIALSGSNRNVGTWSLVIGSRSWGQAFEEHFSLFNVSLLFPPFPIPPPAFPSLSLLCHIDHPSFSGSLHQSYVCLFSNVILTCTHSPPSTMVYLNEHLTLIQQQHAASRLAPDDQLCLATIFLAEASKPQSQLTRDWNLGPWVN